MSPSAAGPHAPGKIDELFGMVLVATVCVLAIVYIVVPVTPVLIAWQVVAVGFLILEFTVFRNRSTRNLPVESRPLPRKVLEYLSWVLPIVASGTGVASGVRLLTTEGANGTGGSGALLVGLLGSISVVVAWLLLQTGFAEIYESVYERLPEASMISFPGIDEDPTLTDFLYMSFTVGTSFAISGATIASRKVRRVILIHSVTSFFYNAFLIAVAIQVVQGIIANS
jgi:uncharacterized membrane protein